MSAGRTKQVAFRVLDALDAPHGGRILRLRLQEGEAPALKSLRGATLKATSIEGQERSVQVLGFALIGGKPSDDRFLRSGRIDVHVSPESGDGPSIGPRWEVVLDG